MKRIVILLSLLIVGCNTINTPTPPPTYPPAPPTLSPGNTPWLPNKALHPGRLNPAINNQQDFVTKICNGGTGQFRPPVADTNRWKDEIAKAEGIPNYNPANFEGDHLIPLSLGGYPGAEGQFQNFWDEPRTGTHNAAEKDSVELWAYHTACSDPTQLANLQQAFANDWTTLLTKVHTAYFFLLLKEESQ